MKSLFSDEKVCYICGSPNVHKHHVYGGYRRTDSERYGCWLYLCPYHHTGDKGVHFNKALADELKAECQRMCMKEHDMTVEAFRIVFNRSYIDE